MEKLYELTNPQKSIWITEQYYKGSSINNICGTAIIEETVDFDLLQKSIKEVIKTNDIFKIRFTLENNKIMQYFSESFNSEIELYEVENYEHLDLLRKDIAGIPFNLFNQYLYKFYIFKFPDNHGAFMLNIHHLLADSWTLGLISREIIKVYSQLKNNTYVANIQETSYLEYIQSELNYLNSSRYQKDMIYWNEKYETIPDIVNIAPCKNDTISNNNSFIGNRQLFELDKNIICNIRDYCRQHNVSLYNFFMAIYSLYISEITNLTDFVIGTPILNRTNFKEKITPGMFISNQAFRVNLEGILDFNSLVKMISHNSLNMLRHQKYPYQNLLEHLRLKNINTPNLYTTMLSYQITNAQDENANIKYKAEWTFSGNCADDLTIQIFDINDSGNLNISYDYKVEKFSDKDIQELHLRIIHIINQVLNSENILLNDIDIITPSEKNELINTFNDTYYEYNKNIPIIKYFEEQVLRHPKDIALVFENSTMTYETLNEKANSLAYLLRENGVTSNTIVGIMENRSFEMIIAILAVLKSGGCYIPIAPEYPDSRIKYMLDNSNASILLTEKSLQNKVDFDKKILYITLDNSKIYNSHKENLENISKPDDLSYIIYTSGSTGNPKGVMLTQKNLTNFYHSMVNRIDYLNSDKQRKIVSITTLSFDIFVFETLISLTRGLRLYITDYYEQKITSKLERLIKDHNIEILQTTPSVMKFHIENLSNPQNLSTLKYIMLAGEQLPKSLVDTIKSICPKCTVYNGYGPSETTIFSTTANVTDLSQITIGKPISNTQIYILNNYGKLLPKNYLGEIYISGDGVGLGYLNREDLTSEKYLKNPFHSNSIMYKSGDLGFWEDSGFLYCKGRCDHQIKINGLRIELGEIEEKINSFFSDNSAKSAVIVKQNDKSTTLNAFIQAPTSIDISSLKKYLLSYLPNYMIPNTFTFVPNLPFTPNGKIDRKALVNYEIDTSYKNTDYTTARNEVEQIILDTVRSKLNAQNFGIDSNIFDYGADSLTIINIITELFKYNFNLKVFDMYKYPTIRELYDNLLKKNSIRSNLDYEHFKNLNNIVNSFSKETNCKSINNRYSILLTGATGFLGCHILAQLLDEPSKIEYVFCTMRTKANISAKQRLLNKVHFYFGDKYDSQFNKYVKIVEGDISEKNFGLSEDDYSFVQNNVDILIHSAANVKHYGKYSTFEKINVTGTKNVIEFCKKTNIPIHYISTMTVSGNYLLKQNQSSTPFDENTFYTGQNFDQNVYSKSKLIAESLIIEAISNGQTATIYRIGDLTGRYSDGVFQENINQNAIYLRLKSILEIGYVSKSILNNNLEFSPVDYAAKAVKTLIWSNNNKNRIFHIYNPNLIKTEKLLDFIGDSNYLITILNKDDFAELIQTLSNSKETQDKILGIITDFTEDKDLIYNYTIKQNNNITCEYLKKLGFEWPIIDSKYLQELLDYMKKVNFIK